MDGETQESLRDYDTVTWPAQQVNRVVQRRPDRIGDWATITEEGERDSGVYLNNSKRPSNNSDSEPGSRASNNSIIRPGGYACGGVTTRQSQTGRRRRRTSSSGTNPAS